MAWDPFLMPLRVRKVVEEQNNLVKYFKISVNEYISNQTGKPFTCNFTKTKILSDEYFQDSAFIYEHI